MPQEKTPQSANVDVTPEGQAAGIQLPPILQNLLTSLKDERKSLIKEMPVTDKATRDYLAHFLFPKLIESVEALGVGLTETYNVASQAFVETSRMREYVDKRLARADRDDSDDGFVRVDPEDLDTLRETLAALGLLLMKKLPDDSEVQVAMNLVVEAFVSVGGDGAVEEDEGDEDDEDEDDEDDEEKPAAPGDKPVGDA